MLTKETNSFFYVFISSVGFNIVVSVCRRGVYFLNIWYYLPPPFFPKWYFPPKNSENFLLSPFFSTFYPLYSLFSLKIIIFFPNQSITRIHPCFVVTGLSCFRDRLQKSLIAPPSPWTASDIPFYISIFLSVLLSIYLAVQGCIKFPKTGYFPHPHLKKKKNMFFPFPHVIFYPKA